tara:strand:+ start:1353 stop:1610 length:258 start_codon:yes stop_codon:yes gene_type:complete
MSNPLIRSVEHFVLLEPDKKERIVSREEAIEWLKSWIQKVDLLRINQNAIIEKEENISSFLENTCELEIKPGFTIKWFAVRINPD